MRTLALLAALLLLAFQAQAEPLQETADQVPTQDQPEAEDQDVAISFTEEERVARESLGDTHVRKGLTPSEGLSEELESRSQSGPAESHRLHVQKRFMQKK
ncbi:alpha-defensin 1-like [Saccopteryx bilineata]|uniref:alpha-defensin 1-like n=1 Tax=Saccopteryx bilineata TaxID=59482 RepID=UPI00338EC389